MADVYRESDSLGTLWIVPPNGVDDWVDNEVLDPPLKKRLETTLRVPDSLDTCIADGVVCSFRRSALRVRENL